jgi:hypothetical protein
VLRKLYSKKVSVMLYSEWDAGWFWRLGTDWGAFVEEGRANDLDDAVRQLDAAARRRYPEYFDTSKKVPPRRPRSRAKILATWP